MPRNGTVREISAQLEAVAQAMSVDRLSQLKWQVVPGDRVAVYGRGREIRFILTGPSRTLVTPPRSLAGDEGLPWRRLGVVDLLDVDDRMVAEELEA